MENLIKGPNLGTQLEAVDDWESQNEFDGGVAVWSIPPEMAPAYNPMIFSRAKYYIQSGSFQPSIIPNFLRYSQVQDLEFDISVEQEIFVKYISGGNAYVESIPQGERSLQEVVVDSVLGLSLSADGPFAPYIRTANYYYIIPTTTSADATQEYAIVDDGYLLTTSLGYVLYANEEVEGVSLTITNRLTGEQGVLSGTSYKGAMVFDVAPIVRMWFAGNLQNVDEDNLVVADSALFVRYSVDAILQFKDFVALNAVAQIGESTDLSSKEGEVLTTKPMLIYYKGYPLDYSILSGREIVPTPNGSTIPYSVSRVYVLEGLLLLLTENGTPILTEAGEYIYLYTGGEVGAGAPIEVVQRCVPASPFYVRWINTEGGVDYWMFQRSQERSVGVSDVERARVYVPYPAEASTNQRTVAFATKNTIKVGALGVKKGDFDALRKLPLSPLVEWWNEATQKWVGLNIESFELNYSTGQPLHDVEMTFALPAIYTQQSVWQ